VPPDNRRTQLFENGDAYLLRRGEMTYRRKSKGFSPILVFSLKEYMLNGDQKKSLEIKLEAGILQLNW